MHLLFQKADELSRVVIGAAIEVHRLKGRVSSKALLDVPLGLIINFHEMKLTDGLVPMIQPGANCADE